jgi:hypothetical protein
MPTPTLLATHPSPAAQPNPGGRYIKDIAVWGDKLVLGYGDYSYNKGPIDVATVDMTTGETGIALNDVPTEELDTYRLVDGALYAPWIDPQGWGGATNPPNGGYTTNKGGTWHNVQVVAAGHVYDYARLGDSEFLVGNIAYDAAGVWQSKAGGPYSLVKRDVSASMTTWERFYWAVVLNGKLYVQAKHNGGTETQPSGAMFPMRVFDGTKWTKSRASITGVSCANDIEVYKNKAYFGRSVFNGTKVTLSGIPLLSVVDYYVDGGYLYAVDTSGKVVRYNGTAWTTFPQYVMPEGVSVRSLAVHDGKVYFGTNQASVYRASL